MPISFQPASSAAASLRSEPLLSPPLSHKSSEDVPFKADESDRVSLSMKKSKLHRHGSHHGLNSPTASSHRVSSKGRKAGPGFSPLPLRKVYSQPSLPTRFVPDPANRPARPKSRARRWTVPSKAPPTRALATVVPVQRVAGKRSSKKVKSSSSPAMITLRRATASPPTPRLSLTSFPPPKFGRRSSGFLSTIFDTITPGNHDTTGASGANGRASTHEPASLNSSSSEVRPATSSVAPPVRTEVVTLEPQHSFPGHAYATEPVRRCSTRYISDDGVYEIIWDQNSSASASEGAAPSPQSREWALGRRHSGETETLERRLSRVLMQSRRTSVQDEASRRGSYWPGNEMTYAQGLRDLLDSPKLARLARETAFRTLPRSKASRATLTPAVAQIDVTQQAVVEPAEQRVGDEGVEFFPPLHSRSNTGGSTRSHDTFPSCDERGREAYDQLGMTVPSSAGERAVWSRRRSSYGNMIGISRHFKRKSVSAGPRLYSPRIDEDYNPSEGRQDKMRENGTGLDDDTVPLLGIS